MAGVSISRRAFTLLEMMAALAISSVIATAAIVAFVNVSRSTRRVEQQAHADEEAKLLVEYLVSNAQQAAGGSVRPWMGIQVDNNTSAACAATVTIGAIVVPVCNGSDRLHILMLDPTPAQCTIQTAAAGSVTVCPGAAGCAGTCCLVAAQHQGKDIVLVPPEGGPDQGQWRSTFCTAVNAAACSCALGGGQSAYSTPGAGAAAYSAGVLTVGTTWTVYLDRSDGILRLVADTNGNGTPDLVELADHVADFQVQLGFDTNGDQVVDVYQAGYGGMSAANVRMINLGVIVQAPVAARDTLSKAQLFDGPVRSAARGFYLRASASKATLRNLDIFY